MLHIAANLVWSPPLVELVRRALCRLGSAFTPNVVVPAGVGVGVGVLGAGIVLAVLAGGKLIGVLLAGVVGIGLGAAKLMQLAGRLLSTATSFPSSAFALKYCRVRG